jgi:flavin reductase (DIM6/NTAB) family NADH-FMN oxidoreductase RutF
LVSCLDRTNDKANIITLAWCGVVSSKPPMLGISIRPSRHSNKLIRDTRDFAVNIPTVDMLRQADICGIVSGRDTDKFAACSFTRIKSSRISSPIISECPVNIECALKDVISLGAHDLFLGEVVAVHADDKLLGKGGRIDFDRAAAFVYMQGEYREVGRKIGHYGFSSK